mmetsp:Transcript_114379/g.243969  ORF Transcript_114379/g.243969 Transcript_114379/m.243969 type:complete len:288 (+) Transcript_114379:84-947(+)
MCWSFRVSVIFATIEFGCLAFLIWRSLCNKKDPVVQAQRFIIPLLITVFLVEVCEAFIWVDEGTLLSIFEGDQQPCPTKKNTVITRFLLFILSVQPLCTTFACRFTGVPENMLLYRIPMYLAVLNIVGHMIALFMGEVFDWHLIPLAESSFKGMSGLFSCTYIGRNGHLHWVWKTSQIYVLPGAFTYSVLSVLCVFACPFWLMGGPICISTFIYFLFLIYFNFSFEAGSVWCWSALYLFIFYIIQPYILNINGECVICCWGNRYVQPDMEASDGGMSKWERMQMLNN